MAYERFGDPQAPPVLLIMGGGAQMINWPEGFCADLVARGLQVIRFDNRDAGLSSHFSDAPVPALVLHGAADVMCDVSGGRATAAAIPDAKLVIIDGMGHSLPRQLWPVIATQPEHRHWVSTRSACP